MVYVNVAVSTCPVKDLHIKLQRLIDLIITQQLSVKKLVVPCDKEGCYKVEKQFQPEFTQILESLGFDITIT